MEKRTIAEINQYKGATVNPLNYPDTVFELYSVPSFETQYPEIMRGQEIGSSKITVEEGDILICKINPRINRVWVVKHYTEHPLLASSEWIVVRNPAMDSNYLRWYFSSPKFRKMIISQVAGIGGSLTRAQPKQVVQYPVPVVDIEKQKKISKVLDKVESLINQRKQQLEKLDLLVKSKFIEMFGDIILNTKCWPVYSLSKIAQSRLGKMLDAKKQTGEYPFPYLANFNVQWFRFELSNLNKMDFSPEDQVEFELIDGDLLICEGGEIGRCAVWHNDIKQCYFQKAIHRVRCDTKLVLPDYLAWFFKINSDYNGFEDVVGSKATIAHLTGVKLKNLTVPVPPIEIQKHFAEVLKQADKSKFAIQQSINKLETLKKALMQKYFG